MNVTTIRHCKRPVLHFSTVFKVTHNHCSWNYIKIDLKEKGKLKWLYIIFQCIIIGFGLNKSLNRQLCCSPTISHSNICTLSCTATISRLLNSGLICIILAVSSYYKNLCSWILWNSWCLSLVFVSSNLYNTDIHFLSEHHYKCVYKEGNTAIPITPMYQKITSIKQLFCLCCKDASESEIHPSCSMGALMFL